MATMRSLGQAAFVALMAGFTLGRGGLCAQQKVERRFPVAPDAAVRIFNLVGTTRIVGWARDTVWAVAAIPEGGGSFYGGGSGRMAKLGVGMQDGSLPPAGTTLEVKVPWGARVWVKSASASVEVSGVQGEIEVSSVTGRVTITGDPRLVTVEALDGDVEVNGAATLVRVRTGAGAVRLTGVRGDVSAATVGGALLLRTEEIVNARLETISGPVDVAGRLPPNGVLDVQTHDGDATVALERPLDGRFDLTSVEGKIVTRLFDQPERVYQEHAARFAVGPSAGLARGFRVTVRSFKGTIRVRSNPKTVGGV